MSEDKQIPNLNQSNHNQQHNQQSEREVKLKNIQEENNTNRVAFENTGKSSMINRNCHLLNSNKGQSQDNGIGK